MARQEKSEGEAAFFAAYAERYGAEAAESLRAHAAWERAKVQATPHVQVVGPGGYCAFCQEPEAECRGEVK